MNKKVIAFKIAINQPNIGQYILKPHKFFNTNNVVRK